MPPPSRAELCAAPVIAFLCSCRNPTDLHKRAFRGLLHPDCEQDKRQFSPTIISKIVECDHVTCRSGQGSASKGTLGESAFAGSSHMQMFCRFKSRIKLVEVPDLPANAEAWVNPNPQPPTLNPQPSTLNHQPSTLNPKPPTLDPQP